MCHVPVLFQFFRLETSEDTSRFCSVPGDNAVSRDLVLRATDEEILGRVQYAGLTGSEIFSNCSWLVMERIPEALLHPRCYPGEVESVKMLQTHTAWVFLTGEYAYKVKKPVDFGFLDYTSIEKRRKFCLEELRLNKRLCPWVYLDVVPVVRRGAGFEIGESGEAVDYAVRMKELPQDAIMTELVEKRKINFELIDRVARIVADFHDEAEMSDEISKHGSIETVRYNWEENFSQTEKFVDVLMKRRIYDEIKGSVERFMDEKHDLFAERVNQEKVRWLHGDFHSGNIFVTDRICIFDCIEFNPRFSCSDVASEIAFFTMDLDFLGSKELGDYFVYRYIEYSKDTELLRLLDFYKCYRAYVRGKVLGFKVVDAGVKDSERRASQIIAEKYFMLSNHYANSLFGFPVLILVYGLPGVGKSSVSRELSRSLNVFHLRTDVLRKELAAMPVGEHGRSGYGEGVYSSDMSADTYRRVLEVGEVLLSHGKSCILDGSFLKREWRLRARELALKLDVPLYSVYCKCAEDVVFERMAARTKDPSDATQEIYVKMKDHFEPPDEDSITIDTSEGTDRVVDSVMQKLKLKG